MSGPLAPDLCIIGAGSGGLAVAAGAAQMGAEIVLVERGLMGGDCLNFGCIPSKSLLGAARLARRANGRFGDIVDRVFWPCHGIPLLAWTFVAIAIPRIGQLKNEADRSSRRTICTPR